MADTSNLNQALQAQETFRIIQEISNLLNTGLDAESLAICIHLCELGVNPESLAAVIQELRRGAASVNGPLVNGSLSQERATRG